MSKIKKKYLQKLNYIQKVFASKILANYLCICDFKRVNLVLVLCII